MFEKHFATRSLQFTLSNEGIDEASEWLTDNLKGSLVAKQDRTRARLTLEEALMNTADHFDDERRATVFLERRFRKSRLRLVVEGTRFNPLNVEDEGGQDDFSASLFSAIGMRVQYSYAMGANVLRISLPRKSLNLVVSIFIAIAVGTVIGILGNAIIPNAAEDAITATILNPIADMWFRLLQAISGPVIFLTALVGALSMKHVTDFGVSRVSTMVRYFAIGTAAVLFALACSLVVFPTSIGASEANRELLSGVLDSVLKVVPSNLITPFVEANTLQLLLIAIVTGHILATLDAQVPEINAIIRQLFKLGLTVAQQACAFVPFFVGLLLCLKIWTHDIDVLISMWIPLLLAAALSIVVLAITVLMLSMRFHMSPLVLTRKLKGPFVSTLKTGALDFAGVDNLAESCKKQLGVNRSFAKAALPQGLFLFMPTSGIGICVFVIYASHMYNMQIDQVWLVAAAVLSVVLAVATPPLAGANLLSFIMAFMYLGIPDSAILAVMVFDILFGELCIATDQAMLQLETVRQAELLGFLDEEVLRAS